MRMRLPNILKLFFFVFALLPLSLAAQRYPSFNDVVYRFFAAYQAPDDPKTALCFARTPDGWYVMQTSADKSKVYKKELFWSRSDSSWKKPNFERGAGASAGSDMRNALSGVSLYNYERIPFYGYSGWDSDVIQTYAGRTDLNDTLTEAIARAYSGHANDYLTRQYDFPSNPGKNMTPDQRVNAYIENMEKSLAYFDLLRKKWPTYKMLVGTGITKYSNDVVNYAQQLRMFGKASLADKYFTEPLYDGAMLATATNYLESCAPHAILFAGNDNDTYPLLYLQQKKNLRTDVTIINTNLLNLQDYINDISKDSTLRFTIRPNVYADSTFNILIPDPDRTDTMTFESWMSAVASDSAVKPILGAGMVRRTPYSAISVTAQDLLLKTAGLFNDYSIAEWSEKMTVQGNQPYFSRGSLALLDLTMSNLAYRPVFYSTGCDNNELGWLRDNLRLEGFVYRVVPASAMGCNLQGLGYCVTPEVMYDRMMNHFVVDTMMIDTINAMSGASQLRLCFGELSIALINDGKKDWAEKASDRCLAMLPTRRYPYEPINVMQATSYYKCGKSTKGDALANKLCTAFEARLKTLSGQYDRTSATERRMILGALDQLADAAKQRPTILAKVQGLRKKYGA